MKSRMFACALGCASPLILLVAGCSEVNSGHETDLAKMSLPKGVSDKPVTRPFVLNSKFNKEMARRSSPPLAHN